ncbi:hypothetical protein [Ulvibacter antarcticus]|uniref:Tetratricopeptide repeat protein n=1 Tax=Ulvibacter antarcticus TaxID=442714 RepID=A0A3L9Z4F8_9FLAO|nr:hypothetical protein [Ulvibacter antarcticus]RMA66329.1 hypothetical protein BXY75_0751 [Ulvibacter antarcticus]
MKRFPHLLAILFACFSISISAQTSAKKKTDVNKDVDVVKVYEQVVVEGYGTPFIYQELANAYYFKNEYTKAKKWFEKLFNVEKPKDATLAHRYRQTLKALDLEVNNNEYLVASNSQTN